MFVDECGDQNLTSLDENFPIFTLCGVLMSHSQLRAMEGKISALKKKYWGDKTVILHSHDIRKCDKEFKILFDLDTKRCFYEDIDALLGEKKSRKGSFKSRRKLPLGWHKTNEIRTYPLRPHILNTD